jgi:hypothetical protein
MPGTLLAADWVIDLDIKGFFDNLDHDLILKAVAHHTDQKWVLLYVQRWLKAPLQRPDGTLVARDRGSPQGSAISPFLLLPKPTSGAGHQHCGTSDLGTTVHRCPLAFVIDDGDGHSLRYSAPVAPSPYHLEARQSLEVGDAGQLTRAARLRSD